MSFLVEENIAGNTLLKLVSRGSAIIAELLRLSEHIPNAFKPNAKDQQTKKYANILFDFNYLRTVEYQENKIDSNQELREIDEEFKENHIDILKRFYLLFESIYKYIIDLIKFLEELDQGVFIQLTLESVIMDQDGKQLLCESLYLYGVMLILLDERIEGSVRERILISYLRYKGQSELPLIDEVCRLCGSTGYLPNQPGVPGKKPQNYPVDYFARISLPSNFIEMVVGRLRTDDIYNLTSAYPLPDHRSTALATQACMLYVILFFSPNTLQREQAVMREIVDKHFPDNWIISYYLGFTVDLSVAWLPFKAAVQALDNSTSLQNVEYHTNKHINKITSNMLELNKYLNEGVLTQEFILDNPQKLLNHLRDCNVTIRWLLLHTSSNVKKFRDIIVKNFDKNKLLTLILKTAQLEFVLKKSFTELLESKENRWNESKQQAVERMRELGEYYSGEKLLARVQKNEQLQNWFNDIGEKVNSLDYKDSTQAGRKIQQLVNALEEVEQFYQIDVNLQVKQFLTDTRQLLGHMIRIVNIKQEFLINLAIIKDIAYAWQLFQGYTENMQLMIKKDPSCVLLLRSTFLKFESILELPLVRINQAQSADLFSVSSYYSSELVGYVRKVLDVIPKTVFEILSQIIKIQTTVLQEIPSRLEKEKLKEIAQLDYRYELAKATHSVSIFTEGILTMETTVIGTIQVDPKKLLEDGIRKELVNIIAKSLDSILVFQTSKISDFEARLNKLSETLDGFRRSFEYIQDYINLFGLKIWQEEFSRIINFYVEQECNTFLKKKIYDWQSIYQSDAIPIPKFPPVDQISNNFIGRLTRELLKQTEFSRTVYIDRTRTWYERDGREIFGPKLLELLVKSIGIFGIRGVDRLLSFMIVKDLKVLDIKISLEVQKKETKKNPIYEMLKSTDTQLNPISKIPNNANKLYNDAIYATSALWPFFGEQICKVGQMQLLRKQIGFQLNFLCKVESALLFCSLDVMSRSLISNIKAHYFSPETHSNLSDANPLLSELTTYLEASGFFDPLTKIYITTKPLDYFPLVVFLFIVSQLNNYGLNTQQDILTSKNRKYPTDGTTFIYGLITFLKQFNALYSQQVLAYLGQYTRSIFGTLQIQNKLVELPPEFTTLLFLLEEFCKNTATPRKILEAYIPPYIFNTFRF
eukprot:TRINITY_DN682_c0_g1_i1.p1 TRINITY_DN682_c0_g1~~TRINITY_DN682_c0_g1_i1.p1  ORF type:complete len:1155 (-),score=441.79 TRINITY_DN682_c0_g1_i1:57-3521(-)